MRHSPANRAGAEPVPERRSRLFSWLNAWRADELHGELLDIFVTAAAGEPMRRVAEIECMFGRGLAGDRYLEGRGHWIKTDGCEVTLVNADDLQRAARRSDIGLGDGQHRRNLVVSGIPLAAYRGRRVRIGIALLEFHRLRPPCGYLDRVYRPGAAKALGKGAGIGLRVLQGGWIRVGDRVEVIDPPIG